MKVFTQDPDEKLRYKWDWTGWLEGEEETIAQSVFLPGSGLTLDSETNYETVSFVVISGGADGEEYEVTNRITTSGGQVKDRTAIFRIRQR